MPNQSIVFSTPRGQIIKTKDGSARLEWTPEFGKKWSGHFSRAQKFVDSEVLRLCRPYTPFQTGSLSRSGDLGTVAGMGQVSWIIPYAGYQYYGTAESRDYDPQRGGKWFERMKVDHLGEILSGARKIAGGG